MNQCMSPHQMDPKSLIVASDPQPLHPISPSPTANHLAVKAARGPSFRPAMRDLAPDHPALAPYGRYIVDIHHPRLSPCSSISAGEASSISVPHSHQPLIQTHQRFEAAITAKFSHAVFSAIVWRPRHATRRPQGAIGTPHLAINKIAPRLLMPLDRLFRTDDHAL